MEIEKEIKDLRVRVAACENVRPGLTRPGAGGSAPNAVEEIAKRHWTGHLWVACTEDLMHPRIVEHPCIVAAACIIGALGLTLALFTAIWALAIFTGL